jgi:hypothetical protein
MSQVEVIVLRKLLTTFAANRGAQPSDPFRSMAFAMSHYRCLRASRDRLVVETL